MAPKPKKGDYNGDGTVDAKDKTKFYTDQDANGDGFITMADTKLLENNESSSQSEKTGGTTTTTTLTTKETAASQLDKTLVNLLGRRATAQEKSAYLKGLNALERAYATRTVSTYGETRDVTTSTNYGFSVGDYLETYVQQIADKTIKAGKPLGGVAGDNYNKLMNYAVNMGLSTADILSNSIKIAKGDTDLTKIQSGMQKRAATLYGAFSEQFKTDPAFTLKEATQDYANTMAQMLDLPASSIKLNDPTLQKAFTGVDGSGKPKLMTVNEFSNLLRDDHRFQYTNTAHKEAIDMASSFASAMGFGV